jgi:hypothetical protein
MSLGFFPASSADPTWAPNFVPLPGAKLSINGAAVDVEVSFTNPNATARIGLCTYATYKDPAGAEKSTPALCVKDLNAVSMARDFPASASERSAPFKAIAPFPPTACSVYYNVTGACTVWTPATSGRVALCDSAPNTSITVNRVSGFLHAFN